MADTPRTRAALIALFADNLTGDINAQDFRDFLVSIMVEEYANPYDVFNEPAPDIITTDKTGRGWKLYSQVIDSVCSFGNVLVRTVSNTWRCADARNLSLNYEVAVALDSYAVAESQATLLKRGIVYNSTLSARFSGFIGQPVYLQSALAGSVSVTVGTSARFMGVVMGYGIGSTNATKWFFDPDWSITGV